MLIILKKYPNIKRKDISEKSLMSTSTIARIIMKLKNDNVIERIGSDRNGYWKINEKFILNYKKGDEK